LLEHDSPYLVATDRNTFGLQLFNDPAGPITGPGPIEFLLDATGQLFVLWLVIILRLASFQIIIKPTPAHPLDSTQYGHGEGPHLLPDELESYLDSLVKKAAAYFNMPCSI
jgi:hypothetical protein